METFFIALIVFAASLILSSIAVRSIIVSSSSATMKQIWITAVYLFSIFGVLFWFFFGKKYSNDRTKRVARIILGVLFILVVLSSLSYLGYKWYQVRSQHGTEVYLGSLVRSDEKLSSQIIGQVKALGDFSACVLWSDKEISLVELSKLDADISSGLNQISVDRVIKQ